MSFLEGIDNKEFHDQELDENDAWWVLRSTLAKDFLSMRWFAMAIDATGASRPPHVYSI
jgi:hypothetical protein